MAIKTTISKSTTEDGVTYTVTDHQYYLVVNPNNILAHVYDVQIVDSNDHTILNRKNITRGVKITGLPTIAASGDVITGADNSSIMLNVGSLGTYVSIPGSTGDFEIGVGLATINTYYIGGETSIRGIANIATGSTINVVGGTVNLQGNTGASIGILAGTHINISHGGTFNTSPALANILIGSNITFGDGGGYLNLNGGGAAIDLLPLSRAATAATLDNYDPTKSTISLENTSEPVTNYTISGNSDSQKIFTLYGSDGNKVATYSANLAPNVTLDNGSYDVNSTTNNPLNILERDGKTYISSTQACFLAHSMILTLNGYVPIESIQIGEEIVTYNQNQLCLRKVVWIGKKQAVVKSYLPEDDAGYPVRIVKNAIADKVPYKDMLITAEHCLFINHHFIPVRMLVNGQSIYYDHSMHDYTYYHLELNKHSIIKADGVLTESFLNAGNHRNFNMNHYIQDSRQIDIFQSWDKDAAAPLGVERNLVEPIFNKFKKRANELGYLSCHSKMPVITVDSNLHLMTDQGQVLNPAYKVKNKVIFKLPPRVQSVHIMSRTSRPSDTIGPFVDDRRYLGVLVGKIMLIEGHQSSEIDRHLTTVDLPGWFNEENSLCRWTKGNAYLPLVRSSETLNKHATLIIEVVSAGPYVILQKMDQLNRKVA